MLANVTDDKLCVVHWLFSECRKYIIVETNYEAFYKMKLQNEWGTFIDLKILPVSYPFLWCPPRYLGDPIQQNGGIHVILLNTEYTEYSKTRNIQNVLYLIWTGLTKKQRQRILGRFEILKNSIFVLPRPHYRPYDGVESHLEGWRVLYHRNLMSDNFHKTAFPKIKKNCKLKLDRIVLTINGGRTCA